MSASDIIGGALRVASALAPLIGEALRGGTPEATLIQALTLGVEASHVAAVARVESRAGPVARLAVAAVRLSDEAAHLRAIGQHVDARIIEGIAERYRRGEP